MLGYNRSEVFRRKGENFGLQENGQSNSGLEYLHYSRPRLFY